MESPEECIEAASAQQVDESEWLTIGEVERYHITQTLVRTGYNQSAASRLLGISRHVLMRKIREHGINMPAARRGRPPALRTGS